MILIQVAIIMIVLVLAAVAFLGCMGLWNVVLHVSSDGYAGWRLHIATYLGAWVLLAAIGFGSPRYFTETADGDLEFHYSKPTPTAVVPQ